MVRGPSAAGGASGTNGVRGTMHTRAGEIGEELVDLGPPRFLPWKRAREDATSGEVDLAPSAWSLVLADHPVDAAVGDDPRDHDGDEARHGNPNSDMPAPVDRQGAEDPGDVER